MKKTIFLYSGEGTRDSQTGFSLLKQSLNWDKIKQILKSKMNLLFMKLPSGKSTKEPKTF